ncbi:MAG: carbohydrate ABC transporter permease, partial [Oscillospiraceae bacterium]
MKIFKDKTTGLIVNSDFQKPKVKIGYIIMFMFLIVTSVICIFPPVWIIVSSLKDTQELFATPPTIIPKAIHFEKWIETWKSMNFMKYYFNTIIMAVGDLFFGLFVTGLGGYVISRIKPKGANLVFSIILWTLMMPTSTNMVPLFQTFIDFPIGGINFTNTYFPMWFMSAANCMNILLFKNYFDGIPKSYIESAIIDGCTKLQVFYKIVIPLSIPIITVVSIFLLNSSWGNFLWPYLII